MRLLGGGPSIGGSQILVVDAHKTHLHAFAERNLYVALPPVKRSFHGNRDAPRDGKLSPKQLENMGFARGLVSPCCFRHSSKDLSCVVHGNDFVFAGMESGRADRLRRASLSRSFVASVGSNNQDVHELRILKRVLIRVSGLEKDVRGHSTPGVKNQQRKDGDGDGDENLLDEAEAHNFRSTAARANCHVLLDRPHWRSQTKELCTDESRHYL